MTTINLKNSHEEADVMQAAGHAAGRKVITIVGGGPVGLFLAILLARRGHRVELFEARPDPRYAGAQRGKSINLTISERGQAALRVLGLEAQVLEELCTPLHERVVHTARRTSRLVYGRPLQAVSRTALTRYLVDAASQEPNLRLRFGHRCTKLDPAVATITVVDPQTGQHRQVQSDLVVGADGAASIVRRQMHRSQLADFSVDYLPWRYTELTVTAEAAESGVLARHAFHAWPGGKFLMFAIPNRDGSFNAVIVLPVSGEDSFESLTTSAAVTDFFNRHFNDVVPYMPNLAEQFLHGSPSGFPTVKTSSWRFADKVVIVGDAAAAVVPFYGQGMNAGLEGSLVLDECLAAHPEDWGMALATYQERRKPHRDVLADLSQKNFDMLREGTRRPHVLARREVTELLHRLLGDRAMSLSYAVQHTTIPYEDCKYRAERIQLLARLAGLDLVVGLLALRHTISGWLQRGRARRKVSAPSERNAVATPRTSP
ncbi:FAD-dependent oxidoreductase [Streptomyces sp. 7N604]|uniref:FAD-dependent oxidoreductase n=1 Tax=Streptomyces sp. 7N604 TaxID=3457415 RepID=UPI003FD57BFC